MTSDDNELTEFDRCAPWLEAALKYANNTHNIEDIRKGVANGYYQLWPAEKGALITEIESYPNRNVLHVFLGGGELQQLLDMVESVEVYAKTIGCKSVTVSGRKGWVKLLKRRGARELCTTMAKEL